MERRALSAAQTRVAIIDAVHGLLGAPEASDLALGDVAAAAGVTRATIYNQFGSRRGLLTAAFADQGRIAQYDRVVAAAAIDDPIQALHATLREICRAWETILPAVRRVLALAVLDPEIGEVVDRYEQARRAQMGALAKRLDAPVGAVESVAILGALTNPLSYQQFRLQANARLAARRLTHATVAALGFDSNWRRSDGPAPRG